MTQNHPVYDTAITDFEKTLPARELGIFKRRQKKMKYTEIEKQTGVSPQRAGQIYNKIMYQKEMFERPFDENGLEIPYTMSARATLAVKYVSHNLRAPSWKKLSKIPLNKLRSEYRNNRIGEKTAQEIENFLSENFPDFRKAKEIDAKTPKQKKNANPEPGFESSLTSIELIVWRGRCKGKTKRSYKHIIADTGETQSSIIYMEEQLASKFEDYNKPFNPLVFEKPYGLSQKAWRILKTMVNNWHEATYLTYEKVSKFPRIGKDTLEEIESFLPSIFPKFNLQTNVDERQGPGHKINPMTYDFNGPNNSSFDENLLNYPYGLGTHTVVMVHNAGFRRWKSAADADFNIFKNMIRDYRDLRSIIELKVFLSQKFPDQHNLNW